MVYYIQKLVLQIGKKSHRFISTILRPVDTKIVQLHPDIFTKVPKTAVVMQGPLITEADFTFQTLKLYRQIYPKTLMVLSTWEDSNPKLLMKIRKLGVQIVLNTFPLAPLSNYTINLQIISSFAGIKKAKELGAKYILKTRTDQRLYGLNIFEFCINLLNYFPVVEGYKQQKRLIVPSMYTFKYRLYSTTDMNIFGTATDMINFFSAKLDSRKINDKDYFATLTQVLEISKWRVGEMYLNTEFLQKIGRKLKWTLKDSWEVYRDHFIIVDQHIFDIFWLKYNHWQEYRHQNYAQTTNKAEFTFKDWFNLYTNFENIFIPEKTIKVGFNEPVVFKK